MRISLPAICVIAFFSFLVLEKGAASKTKNDLPDLEIADVWNEEAKVCFLMVNTGGGIAPPDHVAALFIDGELKASRPIDRELVPGDDFRACFEYEWTCSPPEDLVTVTADFESVIDESNELNNEHEEIWPCEPPPLEIVHGPEITGLSSSRATISWETNRDTEGVVRFDRRSRLFSHEQWSSVQGTSHEVSLSGLDPGSVYHYQVESMDYLENRVHSGDRTFETHPLADDEPPTVTLHDPGLFRGIVPLEAAGMDNRGIRKAEFLIDGKLVFTDFSPPFYYMLDTGKYENGPYDLTVRMIDLVGNPGKDKLRMKVENIKDSTYPDVMITQPTKDEILSGKTYVTAILSDDTGIKSAYFYVDSMLIRDARQYSPPYSVYEPIYFVWDTLSESTGSHRIGIEAFDADNKSTIATVDVIVDNTPPPAPKLVLANHQASRKDNTFTIEIAVKNVGNATATAVEIIDQLDGFQAIWKSDSNDSYRPEYYTAGSELFTIKSKRTIAPGQTLSWSYKAVPVLGAPNDFKPSIGSYMRLFWRDASDKPFHSYPKTPVLKTKQGETISQAYEKALKTSDYILVTDPAKLFKLFTPGYTGPPSTKRDEVNRLLSDMAHLASLKQGVLGYVHYTSVTNLQNLLKKGGKWTNRMCGDYSTNGYLLLVGETEIIPSGSSKHSATGFDTVTISCVDLFYANTSGDILYPELNMGRIVGNEPGDLRVPIRAAIGQALGWTNHNFDASHALAVSGSGEGVDKFEASVDDVEGHMKKQFTFVKKLKEREVSNAGRDILTEFKNEVRNRDVIFFRDHGLEYEWSHVIKTDNFKPLSFVGTKPFAFACCCWAGIYSRSIHYDPEIYPYKGIAEYFLEAGCGAYIGAMHKSSRGVNNTAASHMYRKWPGDYKTIGEALKGLKRSIAPAGTFWSAHNRHRWIAAYYLLGDPKFGVTKTKTSISTVGGKEPPPTIDVTVPDFEVKRVAFEDHVSIPGGDLIMETGRHVVPFYRITLDYPPGRRVQNVFMTRRSDPVSTTGLVLPVATNATDDGPSPPQPDIEGGWWPDREYGWELIENPEGSSLVVNMYPFYYNNLTTEAVFHGEYTFEIECTSPTVFITDIAVDGEAFPVGEIVNVDLALESRWEPVDAVFRAHVTRAATNEVVDGLLLESLDGFTGKASYSPAWESAGQEPGYYTVTAVLEDRAGQVLDREMLTFRLGIVSLDVIDLTAAPKYFDIGDTIDISLELANTGSEPSSGTVLLKVRNSTGETVREFRRDVIALEPENVFRWNEAWNSTGAQGGPYTILGYAVYGEGATDPRTTSISSTRPSGMAMY